MRGSQLEGVLDFTGKVVLVTGGVSGIGAGISARFLEAGADVVACSRRAPAELPQHDGRTVDYQSCDVRKAAECRALIERVVDKHGRLDALINNAGGSVEVPSADADPALTEKII
ncbi:MAG: SDR family NAD(P)-dependent oxidoreductase, partial [Gammaproteobacteria bacterium]|nr:SDR family NAD(P)-dependent oxidoreductase [Gammaproteobacteria bacterium]